MLRLVHMLPAVLAMAACGGSGGDSGLATLVDAPTTVEPVEVERVEVQSDDLAAPDSAKATTGADAPDAQSVADDAADAVEASAAASEDAADGTEGSAEDAVSATRPLPSEEGSEPWTEGSAEDAVSATAGSAEDEVSAAAGSSVEDAGSGTSGSSDQDPASAADDMTDEERLLEFAECMRENDVDFPDPVVEADGTVNFGFRPGGGGGPGALQRLREIGRDPDLPAAREACEQLLEGLAFGPGSGGFDLTELQDRLLEFARCMRDNGVDVGDPDLSNFGPGADDDGAPGGPFGVIDFQDPDVAAAFALCQQQVTLGAPRFGGDG